MPRPIVFVLPVLFCALFVLGAAPARAQPPSPVPSSAAATAPIARPALTPEEARRALETLQDDARRAQVIETLRAIAAVPQTASPPATPSSSPQAAPATSGASTKSDGKDDSIPPLAADSLGAQLLLAISRNLDDISTELGQGAQTVTRFPELWHWLVRTVSDPASYNLLLDIAWKLALVMGAALLAERLVARLVARMLVYLETHLPGAARRPALEVADAMPLVPPFETERPEQVRKRHMVLTRAWQSLIRLPYVLARFVVDLGPVLAFTATAMVLLSTRLGELGTTRLVILALIDAYALLRAIECLTRMAVSSGPLSLVTVRHETAAYVSIWVRRLVTVGAFGFALANAAYLLGLYQSGYYALLRIVLLVIHLLVVVIILQCRQAVARAIRADRDGTAFLATSRNRLASLWHIPAIALVLALWVVWALNVRNGYALLLQYFVSTAAVLLVARLLTIIALGVIDRLFRIHPDLSQRFPGLEARANRYLPLLRNTVSTVISAATLIAVLEVWGIDAMVWFAVGQIGNRLVSAVTTIAIAVFAALAVWEVGNALLERQLSRLVHDHHHARAARLRTFIPMLRTTLFAVIAAVVALTALSEIGVNVAPLLAGAGIVGIAVGFGSQKLVQDLITGLFLLLENVVQVGDTVTVSGVTGTVENLSIRTIRLRDGDGSVHIVPFSSVTSVTNASRGKGNAVVNVSIAFKEDTDRASAVLKSIGAELRNDPDFRHLIRSDLELWGVDKVDGSMVTMVGQIPCTDAGRWPVQREFNRRMKKRFQENELEIATTRSTVILQAPPPAEPDEVQQGRERRRMPAHPG